MFLQETINLNTIAQRRTILIAGSIMLFMGIIAVILFNCTDVVSALSGNEQLGGSGDFIDKAAKNILKDIAIVCVLAGIGMGIFKIVKGQTVIGIILIIIAALFGYLAMHPEMVGGIGKVIYNMIFNGGGSGAS